MLTNVVAGTTPNVYVVLAPLVASPGVTVTLLKSVRVELVIVMVSPLVTVSITLSLESVVCITNDVVVYVVRGLDIPATAKVSSPAVNSVVKPLVTSSGVLVGLQARFVS